MGNSSYKQVVATESGILYEHDAEKANSPVYKWFNKTTEQYSDVRVEKHDVNLSATPSDGSLYIRRQWDEDKYWKVRDISEATFHVKMRNIRMNLRFRREIVPENVTSVRCTKYTITSGLAEFAVYIMT